MGIWWRASDTGLPMMPPVSQLRMDSSAAFMFGPVSCWLAFRQRSITSQKMEPTSQPCV